MREDKRMLGETIYTLRKQKGLSQFELGDLVGVSNKAVSKWETGEANPDINLLPLLAETLGVTTDELLTGIKAEKKEIENEEKEAKFFGMKGTAVNTKERFEFVSDKMTRKGLPYVHINIGKSYTTFNAKARGVIAIGNNAKGFISLGLVSTGIISIGLVSFGILAIGLLGIALAAIGTVAIGGVAIGSIAIGGIALGAVAVGYISYGAVAIGYYAHTGDTGIAIGRHVFIILKMFRK